MSVKTEPVRVYTADDVLREALEWRKDRLEMNLETRKRLSAEIEEIDQVNERLAALIADIEARLEVVTQ